MADKASSTLNSFADKSASTLHTVTDKAADSWNSVANKTASSLDNIADRTSYSWDRAADKAANTLHTVADKASDSWNSAANKTASSLNSVADTTSSKLHSAAEKTSHSWDRIAETASSTLHNAADETAHSWERLAGTTSSSFNKVLDKPSYSWERETEKPFSALNTVSNNTVSNKVSDSWNSVADTASHALGSSSNKAFQSGNSALNNASKSLNKFSSTRARPWESVADSLSDKWDTVKDTSLEQSASKQSASKQSAPKQWDDAKKIADSVAKAILDIPESASVSDGVESTSLDKAIGDKVADAVDYVADIPKAVSKVADNTKVAIAHKAEVKKEAVTEFVTKDAPQWLAENESTVNRGLGLVQVVGGIGEAALGAFTLPAGVGVVVGPHGVDNIITGAKSVWTGKPHETYTQRGISAVTDAIPGMSSKTADTVGTVGDIGLSLVGAGGAVTSNLMKKGANKAIRGTVDNAASSTVNAAQSAANKTLPSANYRFLNGDFAQAFSLEAGGSISSVERAAAISGATGLAAWNLDKVYAGTDTDHSLGDDFNAMETSYTDLIDQVRKPELEANNINRPDPIAL